MTNKEYRNCLKQIQLIVNPLQESWLYKELEKELNKVTTKKR